MIIIRNFMIIVIKLWNVFYAEITYNVQRTFKKIGYNK